MRALIAAGLDRSYAAVTEPDLATELAALRRSVDEIADRLAMGFAGSVASLTPDVAAPSGDAEA